MSGMMLNFTGVTATSVPGAPTIGTATATGATTATVSYTAPASNGGSVITSYTATSSPSGITGTLSQAGSGTITVTGLDPSTSYTFTVKATNAIGQSTASAASNSITTAVGFFMSIVTGGTYVTDNNYTTGSIVVTSNNYAIVTGNIFSSPAIYSQGLLSISPTFTLNRAKNYTTTSNNKGITFLGLDYNSSANVVTAKVNAGIDAGGSGAFQTIKFSTPASLSVSSYSGATITTSTGFASFQDTYGIAVDSSSASYGAGASIIATCCNTTYLPSVVKKNSSNNAVWARVSPNGAVNPWKIQAVALDETNSYAWYSGVYSGDYGFVWRTSTSTGAMVAGDGKRFNFIADVSTAHGIALDSSQNVYLGYGANALTPVNGGPLIKINSSLTVQWQRILNNSANSGFANWSGVKYSAFDGFIYAAGQLTSGNYFGSIIIAKFDTSGTIQWQRRIVKTAGTFNFVDGSFQNNSNLAIDSSGNIFVTADIRNNSTGLRGVFVAKIPADGSLTATGISVGVNTYTYEASTCSVSTTTTTTSNNSNDLITMTLGSSTSETPVATNTGQSIARAFI